MSKLKDVITDPVMKELVVGRVWCGNAWDSAAGYANSYIPDHIRCEATDGEHRCNRRVNHPQHWRHISADEARQRITAIWGGNATPVDDGSKPTIATNILVEGHPNPIHVVGLRDDSSIEAIDLTTGEFHVLTGPTWTVVEQTLTAEQLVLLGKWFAELRGRIRDEAVQQHIVYSRWCRDGMNEQLKALAMEEHTPTLWGDLSITARFNAENISTTRSEVERVLTEALATVEKDIAAAVIEKMPQIEGLKLLPRNLTVKANNFQRI